MQLQKIILFSFVAILLFFNHEYKNNDGADFLKVLQEITILKCIIYR